MKTDDLKLLHKIDEKEPAWMGNIRRNASDRYQEMQWPTAQDEEWRRTDISGLDISAFQPANTQINQASSSDSLDSPYGRAAGIIRFVNGSCTVSLDSDLRESGVIFTTLSQALNSEAHSALEELFLRTVEKADNRFILWNYGLFYDGAALYIPDGMTVERPFLVEFQNEQTGSLLNPHTSVILGKNARATLLRSENTGGSTKTLINSGLSGNIGENANLQLSTHRHFSQGTSFFQHGYLNLDRDAALSSFEAFFGGSLVKSRLEVDLAGDGNQVELNGIFLIGSDQHADIRTVQRHQGKRGNSRALYRGAVSGNGRSIFQGLIEVDKGASGTDAYLSNKNLVLNEGARADSIPMLNIKNNDVRCSHGSTTGKIGGQELFYLMARGYSAKEAKQALVEAFFEELVAKAPEPVRETLVEAIEDTVAGFVSDD